MASSALLCFLCFLSSIVFTSSTTITIPLSRFHPNPLPLDPHPNPNLTRIATASLSRAHHLKNPPPKSSTTTPLTPHSYGDYSISLSFGTPAQTIPFIMDTGSDFNWFPCTHRYLCKNCSFSNTGPSSIPSFSPKLSSSSRILGCLNPKCGLIHSDLDANSRCPDCRATGLKDCKQICPPYLILYGSGSTGGITIVDILDLPGKRVPNFLIGCSLFSSHQPAGIAGFGRGPTSFPTQLGLGKFSFCLLSHKFDDAGKTTLMELETGSGSAEKTAGVSYTQFLKNPVAAGIPAFSVYYYLGLRKITVGGKKVKIPLKYLSPGLTGDGGTIVDSGTTFTYMAADVFELVASAFTEQVKEYKRAKDAEYLTGLRPCFDISSKKKVELPELKFHFKGGAEMALPLTNYFSIAGESEAVCLTVVTDSESSAGVSVGPSIILGNFQMQNFYVEYDLRNERFGFRQQLCH